MTEEPLYSDEDLLPADEAGVEPPPPTAEENPAPSEAQGEQVASQLSEDGVLRYSQGQLRRARELLTRLSATRRAARFYPLQHPAVEDGVLAFAEAVRAYHREGVDVQLGFFGGEILLGEQLLPEESVQFDQLVRDLTTVGVGSITVRRGASTEEMYRAMNILALDAETIERQGGFQSLLEKLRLENIELGSVREVHRTGEHEIVVEEDAHASYNSAVSMLRDVDRMVRGGRRINADRVNGVVRSLVDNVVHNRYAMLQLTGLKNYDEYTFYHSANVAILSLALGSAITTEPRFLSALGTGALLHDVGKLMLDLDILNKPGALSPEEWAEVRQHPLHGAEVVSLLPGVDRASVVMVLEHHMRFDGQGYPTRTPQRPQHLTSRIVAVADAYDAMTSRRSYSAARVQDEAMSLLAKSAGTSLDPGLVRAFVKLMGVFPPRSVVRLSNDEVAVVVQPGPDDPLRPVVRVIASSSGELVDPTDIDLQETTEVSINGCIDPRLLNIDVDTYF